MSIPLFSIIIPMYKVADYVTRCIESLEQQDIAHSDYEIICINDGSPDNCKGVVEEFQKKYTNIVLINQENQGVSMARNNGIAIAKGKYILPIDPDDYVVQNSFGRIISFLRTVDCDVVYLGFEIFDGNQKSIWKTNYSKQNHQVFNGVEGYFQARGFDVKDPDRSWAILYKKELLDKYQINYPKNVPYLEDGLFLAKVFTVAEKVSFDNEIFYQRSTRMGSATNSKLFYLEKTTEGFFNALKDLSYFSMQYEVSNRQLIDHITGKFIFLTLTPDCEQLKFFNYLKKVERIKPFVSLVHHKNLKYNYSRMLKLYKSSPILFFFFFRVIK